MPRHSRARRSWFQPPDGPDLDKIKQDLNTRGYSFAVKPPEGGAGLTVAIGSSKLQGYDAKALGTALAAAGYPKVADPAKIYFPGAILVLFILVIYVTMVYGPIAAFLVELFPTQIRYTSMSFPYHIGNGVFGGLLPLIADGCERGDGEYLCGPLVSHYRCSRDLCYRYDICARDQGPGYPGLRRNVSAGRRSTRTLLHSRLSFHVDSGIRLIHLTPDADPLLLNSGNS